MPRVRRSNPLNLPPRVYLRHGAIYYASMPGPWIRLGSAWDLPARTKWAELAGESAPQGSVLELLDWYEKKIVPKKAPRTQASNRMELGRLRAVFGLMGVHDLRLKHGGQYLKVRGEVAPVRANREMALFSHAIRCAMNEGVVDLERNPFEGLIYNHETPSTRLVDDGELGRFLSFARSACPIVAACTRLMYVTAQRRVDLLDMKLSAAKPDGIELVQSKTGAKLLIEWTEELRAAWDEAVSVRKASFAKKKIGSLYLLSTREGLKYTDEGMKALFNRTMVAAVNCELGPPVLIERFKMQHMRAKAVSDVGGGKRGKDLAGHKTQVTTDRVYDRVTFKRVMPTK